MPRLPSECAALSCPGFRIARERSLGERLSLIFLLFSFGAAHFFQENLCLLRERASLDKKDMVGNESCRIFSATAYERFLTRTSRAVRGLHGGLTLIVEERTMDHCERVVYGLRNA